MSTIMLKEGASPVLCLDEETFLTQCEEEDGTFWSLPRKAFDIEMGSVRLLPEYATRFVWSVDEEIDTENDGIIDWLNIAVAWDPDKVVNPGSFCSYIGIEDVEV